MPYETIKNLREIHEALSEIGFNPVSMSEYAKGVLLIYSDGADSISITPRSQGKNSYTLLIDVERERTMSHLRHSLGLRKVV